MRSIPFYGLKNQRKFKKQIATAKLLGTRRTITASHAMLYFQLPTPMVINRSYNTLYVVYLIRLHLSMQVSI